MFYGSLNVLAVNFTEVRHLKMNIKLRLAEPGDDVT